MTISSEEPDRFKSLNKKILLAQEKKLSAKVPSIAQNNMSFVWRMVLELVIGMLFGFGIGFGLDKWLGTAPLMMIIMSLFGFAAGIRTMMMTAKEFANLENKDRSRE
jgi:ATP synthase protein I